MRLFLLPISSRRTLLYAARINRQLSPNQTYVDKIIGRASAQWTKWEAAESGWQKKLTDYGNGAFARIPYQEWGLKSVPPLSARRKGDELKGMEEVSVRFPRGFGGFVKDQDVLARLKALATERVDLHRRGMWWSVAGLPIALPFGLLPVIPNIPFFYLAFRAWSHWRALNGSKHISFLLNNNLIKVTPSELLQKAYEVKVLPQPQMDKLKELSTGDVADPTRTKEVLQILDEGKTGGEVFEALPADEERGEILLPKGGGKLVARTIGIPGLDIEIERALAQVEKAITKAKDQEKLDSKQGEQKEKEAKEDAEKKA